MLISVALLVNTWIWKGVICYLYIYVKSILICVITIFVFIITFSILGSSSGGCWVTDASPATMETAEISTQGDFVVMAPTVI